MVQFGGLALYYEFVLISDQQYAYLIKREESSSSREFSGLSGSVCWGVKPVLILILQLEALTVQWHSHNYLFPVCSLFDPVIYGVIRVEVVVGVAGIVIQRRYVSCCLIPVPVEIVRHHANVIEVPGQFRHVVT